MHSSNCINVINNTGEDNDYNIKEVNCMNNFLGGNTFIKNSPVRHIKDDTEDPSDKLISVDFTMILLFCLFGFMATESVNYFRTKIK